jgi:hypothetical protein
MTPDYMTTIEFKCVNYLTHINWLATLCTINYLNIYKFIKNEE